MLVPVTALVGLGAAAWLTFAGRAEGGPVDDGVPAGTMAFFSGGVCPAGWTTATNVQGRLVVAVTDGSKVAYRSASRSPTVRTGSTSTHTTASFSSGR